MNTEGWMLLIAAVSAAGFFDYIQKERAKFQAETDQLNEKISTLQKQLKIETEAVRKALTELRKLEVSKGSSDERVLKFQLELEGQKGELENWQKEVLDLRVETQEKKFEIEKIMFELEATKTELNQKEADLAEVGKLLVIGEGEVNDNGFNRDRVLERLKELIDSLSDAKQAKEKANAASEFAQKKLKEDLVSAVQDLDWLREEMDVIKQKYELLVAELELSQLRNSNLETRLKVAQTNVVPSYRKTIEDSQPLDSLKGLEFDTDSFDPDFSDGDNSGYESEPLRPSTNFRFVTNPIDTALKELQDENETVSKEPASVFVPGGGFVSRFGEEVAISEVLDEEVEKLDEESNLFSAEISNSSENHQEVSPGKISTEEVSLPMEEDSLNKEEVNDNYQDIRNETLDSLVFEQVKEQEIEEITLPEISKDEVPNFSSEGGLKGFTGFDYKEEESTEVQREVETGDESNFLAVTNTEGNPTEDQELNGDLESPPNSEESTKKRIAVLGGKPVAWDSGLTPPQKKNTVAEKLDKEVNDIQKSLAELNAKLGSGSGQ